MPLLCRSKVLEAQQLPQEPRSSNRSEDAVVQAELLVLQARHRMPPGTNIIKLFC